MVSISFFPPVITIILKISKNYVYFIEKRSEIEGRITKSETQNKF